jgi:uncharacterized damage-inducible protein DinB
MSAGLADFFRYNLWANQTLLDCCEPLTETQLDATAAGVYGSARAILLHLFGSEETYAGRVGGPAPGPRLMESDAFPGFEELRRRAEQSGQALIAFAAKATEADLTRILHLDHGTYDAPVYQRIGPSALASRHGGESLLTLLGDEISRPVPLLRLSGRRVRYGTAPHLQNL